MISKITRVPLREVWKHEATDFTTWLEVNIDVLNEALDLNLSNIEREKNAGSFSVDLVAEDDKGNPVVIENQLEKSNHDHLGKIITYLTSLGAKTAIWIVADPRPEHINAITWLNESSSADFFLLKVEAIKIGDSPPAPLLTLIVGPTEEVRNIGIDKREITERYDLRKRFWTALLDHSRTKTKLHSTISPSEHNWIGTGSGIRGVGYNYSVNQHEAHIELYIDRGKDMNEENLSIFTQLHQDKQEIETIFGDTLEWQELEGRRACRIQKTLNGGYRDPEDTWPAIHAKMTDTMISFENALSPYIRKLKTQ